MFGGLSREYAVQAVADLLHDEGEHQREITIRPEPITDRHEFRVEWQYIEYDYSENAWKPIQENGIAKDRSGVVPRLQQLVTDIRDQATQWRSGKSRGVAECINAIRVNNLYLFKYYFAQDEVFRPIRRYYNDDAYRFEVPNKAFPDVQDFLQNYCYRLTVVDEPEQYCVVKPRHTKHPEVLFNASVLQQTYGRYHVFLMQDQRAVHQALDQGATPLTDTPAEITL